MTHSLQNVILIKNCLIKIHFIIFIKKPRIIIIEFLNPVINFSSFLIYEISYSCGQICVNY